MKPPFGRAAPPLPVIDSWELHGDLREFTADARTEIQAELLRGHFLGNPIFPGTLVLEAVCQLVTAAFGELRWDGDEAGPAPLVSTVHSVRFLAPLLPGDVMNLHLTAVSTDRVSWSATAEAHRSDGALAARVRASFGGTPATDDVSAIMAAPSASRSAAAGWDYARIHETLPKRYPFNLIDRVLDVQADSIRAIKVISACDPCYRSLDEDVTPQSLAYPASLLVDSIGQAMALLWLDRERLRPGSLPILVGARDYRIHHTVVPGDVLEHTVHLESVIADTTIATGETRAGGELIATVGSILVTKRRQDQLGSTTSPRHGRI